MEPCEEEGEASCTLEPDDESARSLEGKWLGVGVALFFFLIFVAWFIRTLSSRQRRLQLISKFHHCCKEKSPEEGTALGYPPATRRPSHEHSEKAEIDGSQRDASTRGNRSSTQPSSSQKEDNHSNGGVVYYTPTHPPSHKETVARAGHSLTAKREHFGHYHTENEHKDDDNAGLALPGGTRPRHHVRGMKKSRSTASVVSVHLAPIQEVDDGTCVGAGAAIDPDAIQQKRAGVINASRQRPLGLNSSPLGSRSHPDRLASLASDSEEDDDNDEGEKMEAAAKFGRKGVGESIGHLTLDNGHVNVNFVHGSDEDESTG